MLSAMGYSRRPVSDRCCTRATDSTNTMRVSVTPAQLSSSAAKHTGRQVPGPLHSSMAGRSRATRRTHAQKAKRVVHTEERYGWPTSRLRGMRAKCADAGTTCNGIMIVLGE